MAPAAWMATPPEWLRHCTTTDNTQNHTIYSKKINSHQDLDITSSSSSSEPSKAAHQSDMPAQQKNNQMHSLSSPESDDVPARAVEKVDVDMDGFDMEQEQTEVADELHQHAMKCMAEGDLLAAEEVFRSLLHLSQQQQSSSKTFISEETLMEIWANLGKCCEISGQLDDAMECYREALYCQMQKSGRVEEESLNIKLFLAGILYDVGMIHSKLYFQNQETHLHAYKAIQAFARSLQLRRTSLGSNHHLVASVQHNLGVLFMKIGNVASSLEMHQKALQIREGMTHTPGIASSLHHMALALSLAGEDIKASSMLNKAVDTLKVIPYEASLSQVITDLSHLTLGVFSMKKK